MLPFALLLSAEDVSFKLHSCWFISYDSQLPSPSFKMKGSLHGPCLESSPFLCVPAGCRRCVLSGGALGCCWLSAEWAQPYLSADKQTCGQSKPVVKRQVIVLHVFFFFLIPPLSPLLRDNWSFLAPSTLAVGCLWFGQGVRPFGDLLASCVGSLCVWEDCQMGRVLCQDVAECNVY